MTHRWVVLVCVVVVLVAVVVALRRPRYPASGPGAPTSSQPPAGPVTLPDDVRAEIDRLIASDRRIEAIKELRAAVPGMKLKDAKEQVDACATSGNAVSPGHVSVPTGAAPAGFPPEALAQVDGYLADGKVIQAIKVAREHTNWGLREAKEWVEARATGR
ncbi:hypothetical protein [Luteimicrobium album]|uniref:hypothetical protein n=1 Tax=Luteimicrobium album TaxID=1054550 RepID=UPI0024E07542|nr:hypothetical protein [Luteimicrobium album]